MFILELEKVGKSFSSQRVLRDCSLSLAVGEVVCLSGKNGSGKTTLLSCIAGLLRFDSGSFKKTYRRSSLFGIDLMLYQDLTVLENLQLHAAAVGVGGQDTLLALIEELRLAEFLRKKIGECSLGMSRRAAFARALISRSDLLLLDEPFVGLDKESFQNFVHVLQAQKKQGVSMLIASHQFDGLQDLCDRSLELSAGGLSEHALF